MTGRTRETVFRLATGSTLAVLALFFAFLFLSLTTATTSGRFVEVLLSRPLLRSVRLTLITATLSTLVAMALALPASYALSRGRFRGKALVDTLLDLPIVVSPVALGAALLVALGTGPGRLIQDRLVDFVFEFPGLILAQFAVVVALAVRLLKASFDQIDPRYEKVARSLGCTAGQAFRTVTLRLARSGMVAAFLLTWARAAGEFGASVTLAGATAGKTETLPIAIHLAFATADVKKAVAVIFVLVLLAGVALLGVRVLAWREVAP